MAAHDVMFIFSYFNNLNYNGGKVIKPLISSGTQSLTFSQIDWSAIAQECKMPSSEAA